MRPNRLSFPNSPGKSGLVALSLKRSFNAQLESKRLSPSAPWEESTDTSVHRPVPVPVPVCFVVLRLHLQEMVPMHPSCGTLSLNFNLGMESRGFLASLCWGPLT